MKRGCIGILLALFLLSGCGLPSVDKNTEEVEVTEVPMPETVSDNSKTLSNPDITVRFDVFSEVAIGVSDEDCILVYESSESFNSALIALLYMPNYKRLEGLLGDVYYKELSDGYVAVIRDQGVGEGLCKEILEHVSEVQ